MSDWDELAQESFARSRTSTGLLCALEMLHSTFPGQGIYLCNYDSDIFLDGNLYTGIGMEASEPDSGTEPDDKISVRLDGVTGEMQYWINSAIITGTNIKVNMRSFAYNKALNQVIGDANLYKFLCLKAQYNDQAVILQLGRVSPTNQSFPSVRYTPANSPELYR